MTLLIGWVGVDQRGPASLYLASDSRISWGKTEAWDRGKKLFSAANRPHILGFFGDVVFPSLILSQIIQQIDNDLLFPTNAVPSECTDRIVESVSVSLLHYPDSVACNFGILHGMRRGEGMRSEFHLAVAQFDKRVPKIEHLETGLPESSLLACLGSGAIHMRSSYNRWIRVKEGGGLKGTSRAVFSALADAIRGGKDPFTGGPPQLVGLYRKGPAKAFGVVWELQKWVLGSQLLDDRGNVRSTKWHNDLFEIVDPLTLVRDEAAQPQPRPRSLQKNT